MEYLLETLAIGFVLGNLLAMWHEKWRTRHMDLVSAEDLNAQFDAIHNADFDRNLQIVIDAMPKAPATRH